MYLYYDTGHFIRLEKIVPDSFQKFRLVDIQPAPTTYVNAAADILFFLDFKKLTVKYKVVVRTYCLFNISKAMMDHCLRKKRF